MKEDAKKILDKPEKQVFKPNTLLAKRAMKLMIKKDNLMRRLKDS